MRQVLDALSGRLPDVAFFAEEDRALARDYLVADVAAAPPPALANLCALADLDLAAEIRGEVPEAVRPDEDTTELFLIYDI